MTKQGIERKTGCVILKKLIEIRDMKNWIYTMIGLLTLCACQPKQASNKNVTDIDSAMQAQVLALLQTKMEETKAYDGLVMVMEAATGKLCVWAGLQQTAEGLYKENPQCMERHKLGYMRAMPYLAALETGKVEMTDTVDVGNGILVREGDTIRDSSWSRGGYGSITRTRALEVASNVAEYLTLEEAFGQDKEAFHWQLQAMGCDISMTPLQMLTFCNKVATKGQIAQTENINSLQEAMKSVVEQGFGKFARSKKVDVAGVTDYFTLHDEEDISFYLQFCGYVPTEHPRYSILTALCKRRNDGVPPSSGVMAGGLFRQVVDSVLFVKE